MAQLASDVVNNDVITPLLTTSQERELIFQILDDKTAAEVLDEVDPATLAEIVEEMDIHELSEIIEAMPPDEAADILGEMEDEEVDTVLREFEKEESEEVRQLLEYGEDTAGGIMTPEVVSVLRTETARQVTDKLRQEALSDEIYTGNTGTNVCDLNIIYIG